VENVSFLWEILVNFLILDYHSPPTTSATRPKYFPRSASGYSTPGTRSNFSTTSPNIGCLTGVRMTAMAKINRFFRRLIHIRQMDFEFAAWQMLYLLIHPQKVYRNFMYRKRKSIAC
jgi:hypothetical protein